MAINNLVAYNQYLNPLSRPLLLGSQNMGMVPRVPTQPGLTPSMNVQGHNPAMLMMMNSMQQMQNYIRQLESRVTGGGTTTPATPGGSGSTTSTGGGSGATNAVAFTGTKVVNTLAEQHTFDMSGLGEQTLIIDGKHNIVTAATVEGEDGIDHYEVGSDNELIITKFDAGDTLKVDGDAEDYSMEIKDGALVLTNDREGIEVTMGIGPSLIGDSNDETMKNILSQISAGDKSLWQHHQEVNFNPEADRTSSDHKVGDKRDHKASKGNVMNFGKNDSYHTYNIEDVDKGGGLNSGSREDNYYQFEGNQNEFNIKGDHGANRFEIAAIASNITIEKYGNDDSLQFVNPNNVGISEGENGEIIIQDYSTNSTVTILEGNLDDVKKSIGQFNASDGLSKQVEKTQKNAKWTKLGISAALTVGSLVVGQGGYSGAISGALGVSDKVGSLISTGLSLGLAKGFGISYIDLNGLKSTFSKGGSGGAGAVSGNDGASSSGTTFDPNATYDDVYYDPDVFSTTPNLGSVGAGTVDLTTLNLGPDINRR